MATALTSGDCRKVADAGAVFAEEKGLLVLRPGRPLFSFWFTVPSGCYGLVTSKGADKDYVGKDGFQSAVWPPGCHGLSMPWTGVSYLVNMSTVVLDLPVKQCKTRDNVSVSIDVALAFRIMGDARRGEDPNLVRKFVYQVKPRGLEQQLRDAQEEAVRALARSLKHTEIYGIRSGAKGDTLPLGSDDASNRSQMSSDNSSRDDILEGTYEKDDKLAAAQATAKGENAAMMMKERLNNQFEPQGVQIVSVMIKSIQLPSDITAQMTEKTMIVSKQAKQRMEHQSKMQKTRMEQDTATMLQKFNERAQQELITGAETLNAEQVKLNDAKAETEKLKASIREDSNVKVQSLLATNSLEVQRVKDRMAETTSSIIAEAQREAAELLAKTKVETETIISAARIEKAQNESKADQIISEAEGKIAPWIEKLKDHETMRKQMKVYEKLAENPNLVISGSTDDDTNLVAVADAMIQNSKATKCSRTAIMAEMALMKNLSSSRK
mmetsp:Transcript_4495/g.6947  ORF Transcript_4495/g.6947 Transcript_4495/m.6947 type:complete len:496 (+) Transcript_4495:56-1543(+)